MSARRRSIIAAKAFRAFSARIAAVLFGPRAQRDRAIDFRAVFYGSEAGERVLADLLKKARLWDRTYVPKDPIESARREAVRAYACWIMVQLDGDVADDSDISDADRGDDR